MKRSTEGQDSLRSSDAVSNLTSTRLGDHRRVKFVIIRILHFPEHWAGDRPPVT